MITSEIGHSTPEEITLRGKNLATEIIGHKEFVETWFYAASARWPTSQEKAAINAILVCSLDHGLVPSVIATRMTLLGAPESIPSAIASGLLGAGSRFLGPSTTVTENFSEWAKDLDDNSDAGAFENRADAIIEEHANTRKIIPGPKQRLLQKGVEACGRIASPTDGSRPRAADERFRGGGSDHMRHGA